MSKVGNKTKDIVDTCSFWMSQMATDRGVDFEAGAYYSLIGWDKHGLWTKNGVIDG